LTGETRVLGDEVQIRVHVCGAQANDSLRPAATPDQLGRAHHSSVPTAVAEVRSWADGWFISGR